MKKDVSKPECKFILFLTYLTHVAEISILTFTFRLARVVEVGHTHTVSVAIIDEIALFLIFRVSIDFVVVAGIVAIILVVLKYLTTVTNTMRRSCQNEAS